MLKHEELKDWLPQLADRLEGLQPWTLESTEQVVRAFAEELGVKVGIIINAIRTVVTGQLAGPGIFDVLKAIGKDRVVKRLRSWVKFTETATATIQSNTNTEAGPHGFCVITQKTSLLLRFLQCSSAYSHT